MARMSPRTHLFAWIVCAILYGPMLSPGSWASAADQTPGREGRGQLLGASGAEMFSRLGTGAMRQAIADGMAKQYAVATVSIADYFPLNDGDYQLFADGTSYSIQGTFTFHGYVAFRRNIHTPGRQSSAQYVSLDSSGVFRQHGFRYGGEDYIFSRPIVIGWANMTTPKTVSGSASFSYKGYAGTVSITCNYLGVDDAAVIRTPAGTLRRCVVVAETDFMSIPELGVSSRAYKILYLAKAVREVAVGDPLISPFLSACKVGARCLPQPLHLDAVIEDHTLPTAMKPGASRACAIVVRNTGLLPWHRDDGFRLAALGGPDPFVGADRLFISPGTTVFPGDAYTFRATFTAPIASGTYSSNWQMIREGVQAFGQSLAKRITAQDNTGALANIGFTSGSFSPNAPTVVTVNSNIKYGAVVENYGGTAAGSFWLELWGSRTGGLTLDFFLGRSTFVPGVSAAGQYSYADTKPLYGIPDGPYSVVFVADRPNKILESDEGDNRRVATNPHFSQFSPEGGSENSQGQRPWNTRPSLTSSSVGACEITLRNAPPARPFRA